MLTWTGVASCVEEPQRHNWSLVRGERGEVVTGGLIDLAPTLDWLRGRRSSLDAAAALNLWNLAGDVAVSVSQPWAAGARLAHSCHAKLTAAAAPWAFDLGDGWVPRWTWREAKELRRVLGHAIHVLRSELLVSLGPAIVALSPIHVPAR